MYNKMYLGNIHKMSLVPVTVPVVVQRGQVSLGEARLPCKNIATTPSIGAEWPTA